MSAAAAPTTAHEETVHGAGHAHPGDGKYVQIAIILAVITAAEVATYYVDLGAGLVPILMVMMVVKFAIVAGFFMHLKFDTPLFRRLFVAGIVLAVAVYLAFLASMQYFGNDTTSEINRHSLGVPTTEQT
jgi:cytochrome c oxidase subunit 4